MSQVKNLRKTRLQVTKLAMNNPESNKNPIQATSLSRPWSVLGIVGSCWRHGCCEGL